MVDNNITVADNYTPERIFTLIVCSIAPISKRTQSHICCGKLYLRRRNAVIRACQIGADNFERLRVTAI